MKARASASPGPGPVERIHLEPSRPRLRLALVVVLLALGVTAIVLSLRSCVSAAPGWTVIDTTAPQSEDGSGELILRYRLGSDSLAEYRAVTACYTAACSRSYQVFQARQSFEDVGNLWAVNAHVNEPVRVEPELYRALALLAAHDDRSLFLAPAYEQLDAVFRSDNDEQAASYDPELDAEAAAYLSQIVSFAADSAAVSLELLGDDTVRLNVSEAYLRFAERYGIDCFADLYWMKNAFVVDEIAAALRQSGLTHGYLVSLDGFGCCLDESGERYALTVSGYAADGLPAAELSYAGPLCLVDLSSAPRTETDEDYYYRYADGAVRSPFLSPEDGRSRCSVSELIAYAPQVSCAELLLSAKPLFLSDSFDETAAAALAERGVYVVCYRGATLFRSEETILSLS